MTEEHTPTDDGMRAFYAEYAEEVFRSWNPGQPVPTREEFLAPFERWLAGRDALTLPADEVPTTGTDTPTEEEVRHDFANMQDWRYDERRAEFNRMLDVRDQAMRAHCAGIVRDLAEAMRNSVGWDEEWSTREVRDALGIAADKIDGTREWD